MKAAKLKTILSTSLSVAVAAGIVLLMFQASKGAELETPSDEVLTPIDFSADSAHPDEMQKVAENTRFCLYANPKSAAVELENKADGTRWSSVPDGSQENEEIKGSARVALGSLLNFRYADRDSNAVTQNSVAGCVSRGNFSVKSIPNGVRFDFYFEKEGFLIPLELTLTDKGLKASVPLGDIREASDRVKLTSVSPLPNFGAGYQKEDGYLLLPDGSGMLMPFASAGPDVSLRIYGSDLAVEEKTVSPARTQTARLPVFGMKKDGQALLAIITNGAARAKVNAAAASAKSPYCAAYAEFLYRESTLVDVSQKTFEFTQVNMFEPAACGLDAFTVEYRPLDAERADYSGMAAAYRAYLTEEQGMTPLSEKRSALYVELPGGVMRQESILGIPVNRVVPLNAYDDVAALAERLQNAGASSLVLNYVNWAKGGTESRLTVDMAPEGGLGGSSAFRRMLQDIEALSGVNLYLDLNLTDMMHNQWGYSTKYSASQSVMKEPAIQYPYKMSTFQIDSTGGLRFLLSPLRFGKAMEQTLSKASKLSVYGFSANSLGQKIYSDFGDEHIDRGRAEAMWTQALGQLAGAADHRLFTAANAYAFPYATDLQDVPVSTSAYLAQGEAVPFYAMALHGLAGLSSPSINAAADSRQAFLRAMEAGLNPKYSLGSQNIGKLADTDAQDLGYIDAAYWIEEAAARYKEAAAYLTLVSDQPIVRHEQAAPGVTRTVFGNGVEILVNYTDADVTMNGVDVPAEGYRISGM